MTLCSGKRYEQLCVHAFKPLCSKNFSLAYQTYPVNNSVSKFCLLYRLLPTFGSFFYTDSLDLNLNLPFHQSLENEVKMTSKCRVISLIFVVKCISKRLLS